MYIEQLKRIKLQVEIMMQIHNAPRMYSEAVVEVVRRKQFATTFLEVRIFIIALCYFILIYYNSVGH